MKFWPNTVSRATIAGLILIGLVSSRQRASIYRDGRMPRRRAIERRASAGSRRLCTARAYATMPGQEFLARKTLQEFQDIIARDVAPLRLRPQVRAFRLSGPFR